ncbi:MAG: ChbG/HpnK family deacetylase [Chloroflexi bacterium]|nr:ChbG/HpnK family deacetylase [Chloroflexota bacterium]
MRWPDQPAVGLSRAQLLIVNADDFGMCNSVNEAVIGAWPAGILRSTTLMVPCPWALHAIHFLKEHPEVRFGVHLTAISEWVDYRWGPLTPREQVPSLVNEAGHFYNFEQMPHFLAQVNLAELEREFRAQIETVLVAGLKPTHLDWHCLRLSGWTFACWARRPAGGGFRATPIAAIDRDFHIARRF